MALLVLAAWVLGVWAACGGSPTRSDLPSSRIVFEGALTDLLPEDPKLVVMARPRELFGDPTSRLVIDAIIPDDRFENYRQHTGIDPRELDELVWAELDEGSLCVIRGPFNAPLAVAEMGRQMLPLESSSEEPFLRRGGHYAGARRDLMSLSNETLVAVTGAPPLSRELLERIASDQRDLDARRDPSNPAIASGSGFNGWRGDRDAPFIVVVPGPLGLPADSGVGLLLARERTLTVSVTPDGAGAVLLQIDLEGEFPPGADRNFRALAESLAATDLGAALGMRDALSSLSIAADDAHVSLRAMLPARVLAAGLRVLFQAEITELLEPLR